MKGALTERISMAGKRRWFQFSLRSFLLLLTIFGVWLGLHVRSAKRQADAVAAIKAHGGWVYYDFQYDLATGGVDQNAESWVPAWLPSRLGDDLFHDVEAISLVYNDDTGKRLDHAKVTASALPHLEALPDLKGVYLDKTQATDEGMRHIGGLKKLEVLMIWDTSEITDVGASHLKNLTKLKCLHLSNSRISDKSLKTFSQIPRLEDLSLQGSQFSDEGLAYVKDMRQLKRLGIGLGNNRKITDEGLIHLKGLTRLQTLDLQQTAVTAKGLEHLTGLKSLKWILVTGEIGDLTKIKRALPTCQISQLD